MTLAPTTRLALSLLSLLASCQRQPAPVPGQSDTATPAAVISMSASRPFLGLRTAKYSVRDLAQAKAWYAEVLGIQPYFDQPFYVGFNVGGYELGLVPDSAAGPARPESGVAYWGVSNADSSWTRLLKLGATPFELIQDVGDGIRIGAVHDPFGNVLGIIENSHFQPEP